MACRNTTRAASGSSSTTATSILRLAGVHDIESWRPLQAEVVQPRQLPDGLIEALLRGRSKPDLFVLELATYPEARLVEQVLRDMTLVYLDRREVPDVITVVLHPKGNLRVSGEVERTSPERMTRWRVSWKVVELWTLPAELLLAGGDVGLIPWVPLTHFDGPPEPIFQECRNRIDRDAPPDERENLLAVTQVLAGLRYNDPRFLKMLGGRPAMIESPVLQELKAEWRREGAIETERKLITEILADRFGAQTESVLPAVEKIDDQVRLGLLVRLAAHCQDLQSFFKELADLNPKG